MTDEREFPPNESHIASHREWLEGFDARHRTAWELLNQQQPAAALFEACVRSELQRQGVGVSPAAMKKQQMPDFRCDSGGREFFVEAKMMTDEKAAKETSMPLETQHSGPFTYTDLAWITPKLLDDKLAQCGGVAAPCVVALGTFAFWPSTLCADEMHTDHLLTGPSGAGMRTGATSEHLVPRIPSRWPEPSCFLSFDRESQTLVPTRREIAGVMLFGLGCHPWQVMGVLHPSPTHAFDRGCLPLTRFRGLAPGFEQGQLIPREF